MLTLIAGFVISVSMLYSFNIKEPHHARGHAYAHSSSTGIAFTLLYMLKACLGFGVGLGLGSGLGLPAHAQGVPSSPQHLVNSSTRARRAPSCSRASA